MFAKLSIRAKITAVMAFLLFGEKLSPLALLGMALAAAGVWAVNSGARA